MRRQIFRPANRELGLVSMHLGVHHYLVQIYRLLHGKRDTILET
jgi:hypothetical protein